MDDINSKLLYMNKKKHGTLNEGGARKTKNESTAIAPIPKPIDLSVENIYKLIDLYFKQKNIMYSHLHNSFDKLLDDDIRSLLKNGNNVFFEKITKDKMYRYKFVYDDLAIKPPTIENEDELMFPSHARTRNLTYSSKIVATITQVQEVIDIATDTVTSRVIGQPEYEYPMGIVPILVRSKYCSLNLKKNYDKTECEYDPGGYFIVNGSEKVVMSLERIIDNKPLVFTKKDSSALTYTVQVNSRQYTGNDMVQIVNIRMKKDKTLIVKVQILSEVSVFILMRALGIESDKDLIFYSVYDLNDTDMINLIRLSIDDTKNEETGIKIRTQEEALDYLANKMRVFKKYSETDKNIRQQEKKLHLRALLKDVFLPHVEGELIDKAYYLGYMINRLLQCYLGRIKIDDRDSYVNKRVDLPGSLIFDLFKQFYKKMLNECSKFFRKKNTDDDNPQNIINQIKPNIIEQGLKAALLTGAWGKKKGVAQMLQRLTYLQTISSFRRINSPTVDASTNKLTSPRHLHGTQIGFCCLTGDTQILMGDGKSKKLMVDINNDDIVMTVDRETLQLEPSPIKNKFTMVPDKLYKIVTITGRNVKCTGDHPFLVQLELGEFKMILAEELKVGYKLIIKYPVDTRLVNLQEYIRYKKHTSDGYRCNLQKFDELYSEMNSSLAIPIESITEIPIEPVYDFTTLSNNHSFVSNGLANSNCYIETPKPFWE